MTEFVLGMLERFARVEERFRRNTTDVETGAAERGPLVDAGDFLAELSCTNRSDVATRSAADHYQVKSISHSKGSRKQMQKTSLNSWYVSQSSRQKLAQNAEENDQF